jgi:prolyl oligopeptidase
MPWRALARSFFGLVVVMAGTVWADEPDDAYRWLEEVTGERPLGWVRERNAESTAELAGSEAFAKVESRILAALDSDAKIPFIQKIGPLYYNFWKDARHRRGIWRRTTLEEYRKPEPKWETVLDIDALNATEHENWVWHGAEVLKPDKTRCLVSLSRGGADAEVVREFDLTTSAFLAGGYTLPEAKSSVSWRGIDSIYVGTDFGPGSLTKSGYPRVVKEWRRGTPLADAVTVYEAQPDDMSAHGYRDLTPGFERDFVQRQVTFWTSELYFRKGGQLVKVEKPDDAVAAVHREWLFLRLRSEWNAGGRTFPAGALVVTGFDAFLNGARQFEVLFEPTERKSLAAFHPTLGRVLLNELDNVRNRLFVLTPRDGRWERAPLPGAPELGMASVGAVDDDESDDYFLTTSGYLTPTTLSLGTAGGGPAGILKQMPAFFDATGLAVSQYEAVSRDGTRVPYFQVARQGLALDGANPTLLYGYGGFEIAMVPAYSPSVGIGWLEKGGVYVVANIRGGGEFGPRWHQAALKANRPLAYEDFQAVAEDLIRRQVTSPAHLGIQGGSNGGLLVGNMLTRTPELFGAVVCQVPLLDMRRYHTLLAGASWMGEYGNPDIPEEWEFIRTFSPYHRLREGVKYPRTLFMTSTRDDRVHPGHARKMAAKMKAMGLDLLYYENIEGGHGGAADNKQLAFMQSLAYTFLWQELK